MAVKVKTIAREAVQEALTVSLRDELARLVREAVADALAGIDWGNGRFSAFTAVSGRCQHAR